MKPAVTAAIRRAIIRAAHDQTHRLWPDNVYPDAAEMTAAMLGTTADEVRHVALGEPRTEGSDI